MIGIVALTLVFANPPAPAVSLKVDPRYTCTRVADATVANDISAIHIDHLGRIHAAGPGYIRELILDEHSGMLRRGRELILGLSDAPMGLLREGETLYGVAQGGLWKVDLPSEKPAEFRNARFLFKCRASGEHEAHAVRRGRDGALYLLTGNTAQVPIVPKPTAGLLLRIDEKSGAVSVVAEGLRNPYDFDFDGTSTPHTWDSDNERCLGLPWYEGARFLAIRRGGHYGWLNPQFTESWRRPPEYFDCGKPILDLGRASPTGVAYAGRSMTVPTEHSQGFFLADWTFGRVLFVDPTRNEPQAEAILTAVGTVGFAPTSLAIHPISGDLWIASGGRGTQGTIDRLRPKTTIRSSTMVPPSPKLAPAEYVPVLVTIAKLVPRVWEAVLRYSPPDSPWNLVALRALMHHYGDIGAEHLRGTVLEGYSLQQAISETDRSRLLRLHRLFQPNPQSATERERLRWLGFLAEDDSQSVQRIVQAITPMSAPADDLHRLIVLALCGGERTAAECEQIALALIGLDAKYTALQHPRERNYEARLRELVAFYHWQQPALATVILQHPQFRAPTQAILIPNDARLQARAARLWLNQSWPLSDWQSVHLAALAHLPLAERRPLLRALTARPELLSILLKQLGENPEESDRPYFRAGLQSRDALTVQAAWVGWQKYPARKDDADIAALILALRSPEPGLRKSIAQQLQELTEHLSASSFDQWQSWAKQHRPGVQRLLAVQTPDLSQLRDRLQQTRDLVGDAKAGAALFQSLRCASCHESTKSLGPNLAGVTKRLGAEDLLTSIIEPDRDIPDRYRTTRVELQDGRRLDGIIIYQANDGILLQTADAELLRVAGAEIASQSRLRTSLMPAGLLDRSSAAEYGHLVAYLKTLDAAPGKK
ncbi:MAG: hypothetical protein ACRCZF_20945 [Gemmataceae bacterium]